MQKILVTGGTIFVSKYVAEYYVNRGEEVYVLNRNTHPQVEGVMLIEADRNQLGDTLKGYDFDVVIDVNAYTGEDVKNLLDALGSFKEYILISSSAVYPEYSKMPCKEDYEIGENKYWGAYGTDKIDAERELLKRVPNAYIFRPPYLYGIYNNVYREAFVFDCAMADRKFYLPKDGSMQMQFFHVRDLCRCIDSVLKIKPECRIFNVGNEENISIREWVTLCYEAVGKVPKFEEVYTEDYIRQYFCFADYEYSLDITKQGAMIENTLPMSEGLKEAYEWYRNNKEAVNSRDYFSFIDDNFA